MLKDMSDQNKMQVSKWDLLLALNIKASEIKLITALVSTNPSNQTNENLACTSNTDPLTVSTHRMLVLLALTRKAPLADKINELFQGICFQIGADQTQEGDIQYCFQLVKQLAETILSAKYTTKTAGGSVPPKVNLSNVESSLLGKFFSKNQSVASITQMTQFLVQQAVSDGTETFLYLVFAPAPDECTETATQIGSEFALSADETVVATGLETIESPKSKRTSRDSVKRGTIAHDQLRSSIGANKLESVLEGEVGDLQLEERAQWPTELMVELHRVYDLSSTRQLSEAQRVAAMGLLTRFKELKKEVPDPNQLKYLEKQLEAQHALSEAHFTNYGQYTLSAQLRSHDSQENLRRRIQTQTYMNPLKHAYQLVRDVTTEEPKQFEEKNDVEFGEHFRQAFKAKMTRLKYESSIMRTKFQWFLCRRGVKRTQEIKRFKSIGEEQVYKELLQAIKENRLAEILRREEEAERLAQEQAARIEEMETEIKLDASDPGVQLRIQTSGDATKQNFEENQLQIIDQNEAASEQRQRSNSRKQQPGSLSKAGSPTSETAKLNSIKSIGDVKKQQSSVHSKPGDKGTASEAGVSTGNVGAPTNNASLASPASNRSAAGVSAGGISVDDTLSIILPTRDQIFEWISCDFNRLLQCGMTRRALTTLIELKNQKAHAKRTIFFLQGVLHLVYEGQEFKQLSHSSRQYLQHLCKFAQTALATEERWLVETQKQLTSFKTNLLQYNFFIGRLKAYQLLLAKADRLYVPNILKRIEKLSQRQERADVAAIEITLGVDEKKRALQLLMKNIGCEAVYKCVTKGLSFVHITDYLAIALAQIQTWELTFLTTIPDSGSQNRKRAPIKDSQLEASVLKMRRVIQLSNIASKKGGEPKSEEKDGSYPRFKEEISTIAEEERLNAEAPSVPSIQPLEEVTLTKTMASTVRARMTKFYQRHQIADHVLARLYDFIERNLACAQCDIKGTLSYEELDLENAGHLLFAFVELENENEQQGFIDWLITLSCSLQQTYFHAQIERLRTNKIEAHRTVFQFINSMATRCSRSAAPLQEARIATYTEFIRALTAANNSRLVNNMPMEVLSMCLDYSIIDNYWVVQAIKIYISYLEREVRYSTLPTNAPILLSVRQPLAPPTPLAHQHSQMDGDTFKTPTKVKEGSRAKVRQELDSNTSKSETESQVSETLQIDVPQEGNMSSVFQSIEERDRSDFDQQFMMCRGLRISENKVKISLFGELAHAMECRLSDRQFQLQLLTRVLEQQNQVRNLSELRQLISSITEEVNVDVTANTDKFVTHYRAYVKDIRKVSHYGIFKGALKYLQSLLEVQQYDGEWLEEEQLNPALLRLREQIRCAFQGHLQDYSNGLYKIPESQESMTINPEQAISPPSLPGENGFVSIFVNRNPDIMQQNSPTTVNSQQKPLPAKNTSKKKKEKKAEVPHLQSGNELLQQSSQMTLLNRLQSMLNCETDEKGLRLNTVSFFNSIRGWSEQLKAKIGKLEATITFLNQNSFNITRADYCSIYEEEIGARLLQSVIIGGVQASGPIMPNSSGGARETAPVVHKVRGGHQDTQETQLGHLSPYQVSENHCLQFLCALFHHDDSLLCKQIRKNSPLLTAVVFQQLYLKLNYNRLLVQLKTSTGLKEYANIFKLQQVGTPFIMREYKTCKSALKHTVKQLIEKDEAVFDGLFLNTVTTHGDEVISLIGKRVDKIFSQVLPEISDKLAFQTAYTIQKREIDQKLRTFKEQVDLEENRKLFLSDMNVKKNLQQRVIEEVSSWQLLARMYYLKKTQDQTQEELILTIP